MKQSDAKKLDMMERRLVNFEAAFDDIIKKWTDKRLELIQQQQTNDAYIIHHICELLCEPDLRIVQKKLNLHIGRVKFPLFRNYYREARTDVQRLRLILSNHKRLKDLRDKIDGRVPT